ncbi:uncharacterized protein LOC109722759 [Ananas comosus]|uniref:Uncharacterized protein LOC109722759 n=1 Tax=Ananas comosus TaxID=4615 RepID=A0A6P5GK81_ANACO|nr:uncharacterized protein LOC109722759 [Ananas comosus]
MGGGESISSNKGRSFGMGWWWWRRRRMSPASGGGRRRRRAAAAASAAVICCSPVLLPLLCLCLPFLCVAAACLRVGRPAAAAEESGGGGGGAFLGRCEEGEGEEEEGRLLQRYLEDQLGLVGALWDCDESAGVVGGGDRF